MGSWWPRGAVWLAFSAVNDSTYALLFADRLLEHFRRPGWIWPGWSFRPTTAVSSGATGTAATAYHLSQNWWSKNTAAARIPSTHRAVLTYDSDVEAAHGLTKAESYELERFRGSLRQFLNQAYSYQLYFNLLWRNGNRGGATPDELRAARAPTIDPKIFRSFSCPKSCCPRWTHTACRYRSR